MIFQLVRDGHTAVPFLFVIAVTVGLKAFWPPGAQHQGRAAVAEDGGVPGEEDEALAGRLVLEHWLQQNGWDQLVEPLRGLGVGSIQDLKALKENVPEEVLEARDYLPDSEEGLRGLERLVLEQVKESLARQKTNGGHNFGRGGSGGLWSKLLTSAVAAGVVWLVWTLGLTPTDVIWGPPLHKSFTRLEWPEDMTASHTKTLAVAFYSVKGRAIDVREGLSAVVAEARHQHRPVNAFVAQGNEPNVMHLVFTARTAGRYYLTLKCNGSLVRGFPTLAIVEPGRVDARSTQLVGARSSTLVLTTGVPDTIQIDPRDEFGNSLPKWRLPALAEKFSMRLVRRLGDPRDAAEPGGGVNFVVYHTPIMDTLCASMAFTPGQEGWYQAVITMDSDPVGLNDLTLIVLSSQERAKVNRYVSGNHDGLPTFEAELVGENGATLAKPKTVWCTMTSKQLTIRDYILRIFPRKLYTFRLVPSTKLTLTRYSGPAGRTPVIRCEDSFQGHPELLASNGNILSACFYLMLLHKIGGSESFRDKQTFFNAKLLKHHQAKGHKHTRMPLTVDRLNVVSSSYQATRWLREPDWCRLFEVEFQGELGIDHGGVRREWFEVLSKKLFHPSTGLFVSVEENSEAVFPNPHPSQDVKPKMYRFAGRIVGKCLYESAHGVTYRQHLPARLAKSFLAQLVGLRVHYRHFADDAPELYSSKIRFIESNPVEGLELTFSDEEFGPGGELIRTVELKPGGLRIPVMDENKVEYLDLLAQRRMCARIRDQTDQFLQGLHQLVPDALLSLFDESELELMLCGVREYSVAELRQNADVVGDASLLAGGSIGAPSRRTQEWFWMALSSFTPEQLARLLQFATGSSQLPPGGFPELKPRFQIAPGESGPGSLPTAHTCFNMICLPEHSSFKDFERALLTAINEGSEGFGFA